MAETTTYLIAGLGAVFGILGIYLAGLFVRFRNAERELELVQQLGED